MSVVCFLVHNLRYIILNTSGFIFVFIMLYKTFYLRFRYSLTVFVYTLLWIYRCFVVGLFIIVYLGGIYGQEVWYHIFLQTVNILTTILGVAFVGILFEGSLSKKLLLFVGTEIICTVLMRFFAYGLSLLWPPYDYQTMINHFEPLDCLYLVFMGWMIYLLLRYGAPFFRAYSRWEPVHPVLLNTVLACYLIFGNLTSVGLAISYRFEREWFIVFYVVMIIILLIYYWFDYYHIIKLRESARHRELLYQERSLLSHYEEAARQASRISQYQSEIKDMMEKLMELQDKDSVNRTIRTYLDELKNQQNMLSVSKYCSDYTLDEFLTYKERLLLDAGYQTTLYFQDYYTPLGILVTDVIELLHWMTTGILPELDISQLQDRIDLSARTDGSSRRTEGPMKGRLVLQGAVIGRMLVLHCEAEGEDVKAPRLRYIRHVKKKNRLEIDISEKHGKMRVLVGIPF